MGARTGSGIIAAGLIASLSLSGVAWSQNEDRGGPRLTATFGTTARVDDNFNLGVNSAGTSSFMTHTVGIDYVTQTRTQRLAFGISGVLRYGDIKGGTSLTGFDGPQVTLDYDREGANARFGLDASYSESRVSFLRISDDIGDELDPTDLINDRGTRALSRFGTKLELGTEGPFGATFGITHARRDYTNVTDPELFDTRDTAGTITLRLAFSPVLTGRIEARENRYRAQDAAATRRDTRRISFGLEGKLSEVLRFDLSLGHDRIETVQNGATTTNDGFSGSFRLTRDLPDGAVSMRLENRFSTNGNRSSLTFGRVLNTRRAQLSINLGAARQEGVSRTYLIGDISYALQVAQDDSLRLEMSRNVTISSVENVVELTRASVSYRRQVTELSALGLSLNYYDANRLAGTAATTDRTRATLQLTYDRQLSRDWMLTGGIEHRYLKTQGVGTARSNAVFLSLNKSFDILP